MTEQRDYLELLQLCLAAPKQLTLTTPGDFISEIQTSGYTIDELKKMGWLERPEVGRPKLVGKTVSIISKLVARNRRRIVHKLDPEQVENLWEFGRKVLWKTLVRGGWLESDQPGPEIIGIVLEGKPWLTFRKEGAGEPGAVIVVEIIEEKS